MPALRTRDTPLELMTELPSQPPSLSIIAPTPRSFTFPTSHNLHHGPYTPESPHSQVTNCSTPPPMITYPRTLSLETTFETPLTVTTLPKHRKSSSAGVERRPKKGDEDYIKRPENAFILFRRAWCEDRQASGAPAKKQRQAELSKLISAEWKSLPAAERQVWEDKARERKREHERLYPNYVYRPQRSKKNEQKELESKEESDPQMESTPKEETAPKAEKKHETISIVIPCTKKSRSQSAPVDTEFQSFTVPSIFGVSPSCPNSPSLLPLISQKSNSTMNVFDYIPPGGGLLPSPFSPGEFEPKTSPFLFSQLQDTSCLALPMEDGISPNKLTLSPTLSVSSWGTSSGPCSPNAGPFTPTSDLSHSFSHLNTGFDFSSSECGSNSSFQIMTPETASQDLDIVGYSWNSRGIWPEPDFANGLHAEDFDITAIPPIQIGVPKFGEELVVGAPHLSFQLPQDEFSQEPGLSPLSLDDVLADE